jgi:hypothetical protein
MPASRWRQLRPAAVLTLKIIGTGLLLGLAGCQFCAPRGAAPVVATTPMAQQLPDKFESVHAVVFEYSPHWWWPTLRMAALGYSTVDSAAHAYRVVCLTPMGIKLFEVFNTNGEARVNTLLPDSGERQQLIRAMSDDVAGLFFDLVPPPGATGTQHGERWVFTQPGASGRIAYTLTSATGLPEQKEIFEGRTRNKTVTFSRFEKLQGLQVPRTMTLEDHRHHYRLIFVLKEFKNLASAGGTDVPRSGPPPTGLSQGLEK